jgi:DNA-binding NarL/FixJ family response regulator
VHDAVRAGASGFLLKDVRPAELVDAIRLVASGNALLAPNALGRLLERFRTAKPSAAGGTALPSLTEREREILQLVAEGLSNAEIAARLVLSEATIKTHVSNLLRKLGVRDRVQAVIAAYGSGLVEPRHDPRNSS